MTIASTGLVTFHVHWLGKRSYVCPATECPACNQSIGAKWIGLLYVAICTDEHPTAKHGLLELTEAAYYRLRDLGQLMGCSIDAHLSMTVSRRSRKSPLMFYSPERGEKFPEVKKIATKEVIADAMATLYGLPAIAEGEKATIWSARVEDAARTLLTNQLRMLL